MKPRDERQAFSAALRGCAAGRSRRTWSEEENEMRSREVYVEGCKQRAREYLDRGDIREGIISMLPDLAKCEDTAPNGSVLLYGMQLIMAEDLEGARRFVEDFR